MEKENTLANRLLVIDDDESFLITLKIFLENNGFLVKALTTGKEALQTLSKNDVDLIILDINLKKERGTELCYEFNRISHALILMLSGINHDDTRVLCFERGADNYITKPCGNAVLLAQIRAMLKWKKTEYHQADLYKFGGFELDTRNFTLVAPNGQNIALSSSQYDLLLTFLNNPHKTLSRSELLYRLRNRHHIPYERTIDIQLCRLRNKLNYNDKDQTFIKTIHQKGYCFVVEVTTS